MLAERERLTCTCCGKTKLVKEYYQSQSNLYKHLKLLPICKTCIEDVYNEYKNKYEDEKVAIYQMCRLFDLPYTEGSYNGAIQHSEKTGWKSYQSYFKQINSFGDINNTGISFEYGEYMTINGDSERYMVKIEDTDYSEEGDVDVKIFWGNGFDEPYDYDFLEIELENWKKTHKCDNHAEVTLLKEICIKILEIRKLREQKKSVSKEQKELQELMKTASVDPAKSNSINSGENVDRFGVWIKDIEQKKPAEWWDDQEKYKDMDGFMPYIKDYIVRPIKNFFTGSKDFFISGEDLSFTDKDDKDGEVDE